MTEIAIFTCSHVRPVVYLPEKEGWFHIGPHGNPLGECIAGIYKDRVELPKNFHAVVNPVREPDNHHNALACSYCPAKLRERDKSMADVIRSCHQALEDDGYDPVETGQVLLNVARALDPEGR